MRKLRFEEDFNKKLLITGMRNISNKGSECYDYLLTSLESSLYFISDGDKLQVISMFLFLF